MPRFLSSLLAALAWVVLMVGAIPTAAYAQNDQALADIAGGVAPQASISFARVERDWLPAAPIVARATPVIESRRPLVLPALYVSFAALQIADVALTRQGVAQGVAETNPLVRNIGTGAGFVAIKAATGAASIYACEKLWKRNRAAAIVAMVALNSAYGTIVAHNYSVVQRAR